MPRDGKRGRCALDITRWRRTHHVRLGQPICRLTKKAFGTSINPHLFRDCAATMIAIEDPSHVRIVPSLLGHTSLKTAERHHNQAQTLEGVGHYHAALASRRVDAKRTHDERLC